MYSVREWHRTVQNVHCKKVQLKGKDGQELCFMCSDRINASDLSKWNMFCKSRRTLFSLRRQTLSGLRRRT